MENFEHWIPTALIIALAAFGRKYLEKKVQNLATKEDAKAIQREIESVRFEYSRKLESITGATSVSAETLRDKNKARLERQRSFVMAVANHVHKKFLFFDYAVLLHSDYPQTAQFVSDVNSGFASILDRWVDYLIIESDDVLIKPASDLIKALNQLHADWKIQMAPILLDAHKGLANNTDRIPNLRNATVSLRASTESCLSALTTLAERVSENASATLSYQSELQIYKEVTEQATILFDEDTK